MRALLAEPKILLLDEPMAGVHPNLAHKIGDQLSLLVDAGMTIVMVEHELSIMDAFCDPVIVLAEGKVFRGHDDRIAKNGRSGGGVSCWLNH